MALAIALPIAVAVLIAVFAGNNLWYRGLPALPKSQDRLLAGSESAVSTPDAPPATGAASSLGPTKVRPVRADFGAVP